MFEHLDRDNPIEGGLFAERFGRIELHHVARGDAQIHQPPAPDLGFDVFTLRAGIGHHSDGARRIPLGHIEAERSPAAAELQNALPVFERRAFAGKPQHRQLSFGERLVSGRVKRPGVLPPRSEHEFVKTGGNLVVLAVGIAGVNRQRAGAPPVEVGLLAAHPIARARFALAAAQQFANARADQPVRGGVAFEQAFPPAHT